MTLAIIGSRTFDDYDLLRAAVKRYFPHVTSIVSGGAKGADALGRRYGEEHSFVVREHLPDWKAQGRAAGPIRNRRIIEEADAVLAFWDGRSRGTRSAIALAMKGGKELVIVMIDSGNEGGAVTVREVNRPAAPSETPAPPGSPDR